MKKKIILCCFFALLFLILSFGVFFILENRTLHTRAFTYNLENAIKYSYKYIIDRNPSYPTFEANCTSFISQCLIAGGIEMDGQNARNLKSTKIKNTSTKWFCYTWDVDPYKPLVFYLSSSFCRAKDFVNYWINVGQVPYTVVENTSENIQHLKNIVHLGDVIFIMSYNPQLSIVVKIDDDIYVNSNSNDRYEFGLSNLPSSTYETITVLHFVQVQ